MSDLPGLLDVIGNNTVSEVRLQPETLAVLLYALDKIASHKAWLDYRGEFMSDEDIELIHELVDLAADDIMRPIVMIPVGAIMMWQKTIPPSNWLKCDGGAYYVAEWPELFDVLGYFWGGSGAQFATPDFEDWSPMGAGGVVGLNDFAGSITHTLTTAQMPSHTHRVPKQSATVNAAVNVATPAARTDTLATPQIITDATGGGEPHNNLHSVFGTNYIIYAGKQV